MEDARSGWHCRPLLLRPLDPMSPPNRRSPTRRSQSRRLVFGAPRAAWISARARNAMRRPVFIGAVSVGAFVTTLVALIVVPQQARRAAQRIAPAAEERVDTLSFVQAHEQARAQRSEEHTS